MPAIVHHVGLTVADLERSVRFYTRYFGLRDLGARNELRGRMISAQLDLEGVQARVAMLAGEQALVELLCYDAPETTPTPTRACDPGAVHVCLAVPDLDAVVAMMAADGWPMHAQPKEVGAGTKMMYVRDPDGIFVEAVQSGLGLTLAELLASAGGSDLDFGR